jgi:hypothetical protein
MAIQPILPEEAQKVKPTIFPMGNLSASPSLPDVARSRVQPNMTSGASPVTPETSSNIPNAPSTNQNIALINSLASYVRMQWERARNERMASGIEDKMIRAKQAMNLEYDPQKKTDIAKMMGPNYEPPYMPLIQTKCRAAVDWILDVYFQPGARPFGIENTPEPKIPKDIEQAAKMLFAEVIAQQVFMQHQQEIVDGQMDPQHLKSEIEAQLQQKADEIHIQIKNLSKELTEKFEMRVDDRLTLGGWYKAMRELVYDIVTMPKAFLKGPDIRAQIERDRQFLNGKWTTVYETKHKEKFERVSPVNIYPLVGSRCCNDGLIERVQYTPWELQGMIGVSGFDEMEIRAVLREAENGGLREWTAIDSRIATLDNRTTSSLYMGDTIDGLIYWGQAPGRYLAEWGIPSNVIPDKEKWYRIYCILINSHVIMARLNPDPEGKVPYYGASFVEDTDKFWNTSLCDILWGHQVTANAVFRACGYNAGMASGPIIEQDVERCPDMSPLYPLKRFFSTNQQMIAGPAIRLYNVQLLVQPLAKFYEFLMTLADFDSGVPRIAHGGTSPGGVTQTASGTSMFLSQSARGIKGVISRIDTGITEPSVRAEIYYLIDNDIDEMEKPEYGSLNIIAKGSSALVVKEQSTIRLKEMLNETNNPVDMQIIGTQGRREMLRGALKSLPLDIDRILPDEFDIINKIVGEGAVQQPPVPGAEATPMQPTAPGLPAPAPAPGAPPVAPEHKPVPVKKPEGTVVGSGDRAAGKDYSQFSQGEA